MDAILELTLVELNQKIAQANFKSLEDVESELAALNESISQAVINNKPISTLEIANRNELLKAVSQIKLWCNN
jgi:hypothetical protein